MSPLYDYADTLSLLDDNIRKNYEKNGKIVGGVYGYVRIPRHRRDNVKYSVDNQADNILSYCREHLIDLNKIYIEEDVDLPLEEAPILRELMSLSKYACMILIPSIHCIVDGEYGRFYEELLTSFGSDNCTVILLDLGINIAYKPRDMQTMSKYLQATMFMDYIRLKIKNHRYDTESQTNSVD